MPDRKQRQVILLEDDFPRFAQTRDRRGPGAVGQPSRVQISFVYNRDEVKQRRLDEAFGQERVALAVVQLLVHHSDLPRQGFDPVVLVLHVVENLIHVLVVAHQFFYLLVVVEALVVLVLQAQQQVHRFQQLVLLVQADNDLDLFLGQQLVGQQDVGLGGLEGVVSGLELGEVLAGLDLLAARHEPRQVLPPLLDDALELRQVLLRLALAQSPFQVAFGLFEDVHRGGLLAFPVEVDGAGQGFEVAFVSGAGHLTIN